MTLKMVHRLIFNILPLFIMLLALGNTRPTLAGTQGLKSTLWDSHSDLRREASNTLSSCGSNPLLGSCDFALDRVRYSTKERRNALKLDSIAPFALKSFEPCSVSAPSQSIIAKSALDLNSVNEFIIDQDLLTPELRKSIKEHPSSAKEATDKIIGEFLKQNESGLIQQVCEKSNARSINEFVSASTQGKFASGASSLKCLRKISEYWRNPEDVKRFLTKHPLISSFLKNSAEPALAESFLAASYLKNIRAHIATTYFQGPMADHLSKKLDVSPSEIRENFTGFGFNRLFSPKNFMGASPTSDVDFNLVFNDAKIPKPISPDPVIRAKEVASFQKKTLKALDDSRKRFFDALSLPLEVNSKYSVKAISEIRESLSKQGPEADGPKNFMATLVGNEVHLFGSKDLKHELNQAVKQAISEHEIDDRVYRQYVGEESLKGSLGIIQHIDRVKDPHLHETFAGNYIGMPENKGKEHQGEWIFSTKYTLMRLYDTKPEDPRTQRLNEVGLNFQHLLVDHLTKTGVPDAEIEKKYDKITASDYSSLYKKYPGTIRALVRSNCKDELLSEGLCNEFRELQQKDPSPKGSTQELSKKFFQNPLKNRRWSKIPDADTQDFGEKYFTEIFHKAADLAEDLKPKPRSE